MNKNRIALRPYLEAVENICRPLSREQLVELILGLAQDEPTARRQVFLDKLSAQTPEIQKEEYTGLDINQLINDIQALKEEILERVKIIENGEYEDLDDWDWEDARYDDEPDMLSDEQSDDIADLFEEAGDLFLNGDAGEARIIYDALFGLIEELSRTDFYLPYPDLDWREERARHARCVYEDTHGEERMKAFAAAMNISASLRYDRMEIDESYPMLQDVIDARQEDMSGLREFYPGWKALLEEKGIQGRPSSLLMEAVFHTDGLSGVEKLARGWGSAQPNGYLFWLKKLMDEEKYPKAITISRQALKLLKGGKKREELSSVLIQASQAMEDPDVTLEGKFEKFYSFPNDKNLYGAMAEAIEQQQREKGLARILDFYGQKQGMDDNDNNNYLTALLMNGDLKSAMAMVKDAKSLGWSYGLKIGLVFGCVAAAASEFAPNTGAIERLLNWSLDYWSNENQAPAFFYKEIGSGLKHASLSEYHVGKYFKWAEKIGRKRVDDIVSNTHRGAYDRAAMVLCCLAEVHAAKGDTRAAENLFHEFCKQKYNRHTAFKREVKAVVDGSNLLKTLNLPF